MHCNCHSLVYRALVTYADESTGEIRVRIPAVTGLGEMYLSKIGRSAHNGVWVVPTVNEQIIVSADDENMTNVFWIHTDTRELSLNITSSDIPNNSIDSDKVLNGSLKTTDFNTTLAVSSGGVPVITVQNTGPSGGKNGDVWIQV